MKYKVTIDREGGWKTSVLNPETHHCKDIVTAVGSFGEVVSVSDKQDDVPVSDNVQIGGSHVD